MKLWYTNNSPFTTTPLSLLTATPEAIFPLTWHHTFNYSLWWCSLSSMVSFLLSNHITQLYYQLLQHSELCFFSVNMAPDHQLATNWSSLSPALTKPNTFNSTDFHIFGIPYQLSTSINHCLLSPSWNNFSGTIPLQTQTLLIQYAPLQMFCITLYQLLSTTSIDDFLLTSRVCGCLKYRKYRASRSGDFSNGTQNQLHSKVSLGWQKFMSK